MSIFRAISNAAGRKSSSSVINSVIEKLLGNKSQSAIERVANKYGGTVGRDPNYTPPAESSVAETSGVMSNKLTTPENNITSLAGITKPDKSRFETIDSSYTPYSLRPKEFRGLPNQLFTRGTMFADGTVSSKAHLANQGVRRFNNEKFVGDQSRDLRNFNETNVPPAPSSLVQPFAQPAQQSANQVFGDLFARQNAVGAPMMFKINK